MQTTYPQLQHLSQRLGLPSSRACFTVMSGEEDLHRLLLAAVLLHTPKEKSVFILDAGNVFEGLFLSRLAKVIGGQARLLFQRMMISRTFTAYQTENALLSIARTLNPEQTLFLGLHPLATFYDEELSVADAERKIERIGQSLNAAKALGFRLWFTLPPSGHHIGRSHFNQLFTHYASDLLLVRSAAHAFSNLRPSRVSLPFRAYS